MVPSGSICLFVCSAEPTVLSTPWKPRHAASVFVHDNALWMVAGNNMESDVWKLQRRARGKLLAGRPDREMNDHILESVRAEMVPLWGERRVYVIPPEVNESDPAHPVLPWVRFTAWLCCYQPIAEPNAGSELVVVWFREECPSEPLDKIVGDAIRSLQWEELAEDFEGW